jgi:cob(I)alamin adenosyltransferase
MSWRSKSKLIQLSVKGGAHGTQPLIATRLLPHKQAAQETYEVALKAAQSGKYDLVICDEINNAVHDGLVSESQLQALLEGHSPQTSLCLTGRDFPKSLQKQADIITNMTKIKHHFDDKFLANKGIDF